MRQSYVSTRHSKYDKIVYQVLRMSAVCILISIVFVKWVFHLSPLWIASTILGVFVASIAITLIKGAVTGYRYAHGARSRRQLLLPFWYTKLGNQTLDEDRQAG